MIAPRAALLLSLVTLAWGCRAPEAPTASAAPAAAAAASDKSPAALPPVPPGAAEAVFAGGCFWCMEKPFDEVEGVLSTTSGFAGGRVDHPTYDAVSAGGTGHAEAVRIVYDPTKVSYQRLLDVFWHNVDPVAKDRQFCDVGTQYRSAIFVADEGDRRLAEASKAALQPRFDQPIATEIVPASTFYPAEEYHQDFYRKNPMRYGTYRVGCGRDRRLAELWGASAH